MLLNFFGALGQKPLEKTELKVQKKNEHTPSKLINDPVLEGLLYGKKISSTELANAIKKQQEAASKGELGDQTKILSVKTSVVDPYILRLLLEFAELTIHMNYPANQTCLGHTSLSDVDLDLKVNLTDFQDPMRIILKIAEFSLLDSTPFYR